MHILFVFLACKNKSFLKVPVMLPKYIIIRSSNWSLKCESHSTYYSYLQYLTSKNQQVRMYSIQSNTQCSYWRSFFSCSLPKMKRVSRLREERFSFSPLLVFKYSWPCIEQMTPQREISA
jgi:hypothetical protein